MGSVKDKLSKVFNKVADKIIPKEIAPLLPIASAFIPGLGLAGTGVFNNWILPQLLTGLGSAKRTGKISPMAQAMTALASYSAGPGQELSGKQQAFLDSPEAQPFLEGTAAEVGTLEGAQYMPSRLDSADALSIFKDPKATKAFKAFEYQPSGIMEQTGNFLRPKIQNIGSALKSPTASWGNAMTAASVAAAPALINEAVKSADEAKAEQAAQIAARKRAMTDYQGAIHNLTGIYGQMGTDPGMIDYFNPWDWYTAKDGGRVGKNWGGIMGAVSDFFRGDPEDMPPSDNDPYRMSPENQSAWNEIQNFINYMNSRDLEMDPSEVMGLSGATLGEGVDIDLLQQMIEATLNPNAKGGRIGYAAGDMAGGLGAMHPMNPAPSAVAPGMPNNMQVDGRNGSFIPMGGQEGQDDVPAMLAKNEFVMTSDAVKGLGNGDVNTGAQKMYDLMNQLEANV